MGYAQTMPQLGGNFTYIFTPSLINETTFGMNLWTEAQKLSDEGLKAYQRATYGINIAQSYPKDNPLGLLPSMSFGGVSSPAQVSYDGRFPMVDDSTAFSLSDNITKIWRAHEFKAGIHLEHALYNQYHQAGGNGFPGNFSFANDTSNPLDSGYAYANAILGNYDTYSEATNRVDYAPITRIVEWFVQDHWKLTSRLSMDVGVRFTYALPQTPNNDNAGNFVPSQFVASQAPVLYRPAVVNGAKVTINPLTGRSRASGVLGTDRAGLRKSDQRSRDSDDAGLPQGDGIRPGPAAGAALRHGLGSLRRWQDVDPLRRRLQLQPARRRRHPGQPLLQPAGDLQPDPILRNRGHGGHRHRPAFPSSFSRTIEARPKTVTAYHASFGVQRNVGWGTVVDASYVGSFGRHLGEVLNTNTVPYGAEFLPQNQNPQTNTRAERQLLPALPRLQWRPATDLPGQFELPFPAGHGEPALRQGRAIWPVLHPLEGHGLRRRRQHQHFGRRLLAAPTSSPCT